MSKDLCGVMHGESVAFLFSAFLHLLPLVLAYDKQGGTEAKYRLHLCTYPLPLLCQAKGITGPWTPTARRCSTMEISAGRGRENQMSPPVRAPWSQRKQRLVSWQAAPRPQRPRTSWTVLHRAPPAPRRSGQRHPRQAPHASAASSPPCQPM